MENWQTWAALAIVAATVAVFVWRWVKKRRGGGKGGGKGGGCDSCG